MNKALNQLLARISTLVTRCADYDAQHGETPRPRFDNHLFQGQSKLLEPCAKMVQNLCQQLSKEYEAGKLTEQRLSYSCERIIAQISALEREMVTTKLRAQEPKPYGHWQTSIHELYQQFAQHQDWERRLQMLVQEKQVALAQAHSLAHQQQLQQQVIAAEGRLARCQAAMKKLELRIQHQEQKGVH
ncbi:Primosomal replication protein N'' [Vibrio stylophorae]|uniref:Primosomal replication protein N n=1 Tax=Vibrio stylophorae TaxID=659351 RepID=A0ABM8ZUB7_9VIBR|nr:primosomal replication protein [Vibrio stylophorae]CAH0533913.1 Primosomal replication protein N'' [Vibrio stylophorae]